MAGHVKIQILYKSIAVYKAKPWSVSPPIGKLFLCYSLSKRLLKNTKNTKVNKLYKPIKVFIAAAEKPKDFKIA